MQFANMLISSVLQVVVFLAIPLIWWSFSGRKKANFLTWLGLIKPRIRNRQKYTAYFLLIILLFLSISICVPLIVERSKMATSQFLGLGMRGLLPALLYAFLQTGLSEELFFRGFLGKRFIAQFGFVRGNLIQALLFGLMHGLLFGAVLGWLGAFIITGITALIGWLMGWINEKESGGSIVSSWMLHGCANTIASGIALFNLLKY